MSIATPRIVRVVRVVRALYVLRSVYHLQYSIVLHHVRVGSIHIHACTVFNSFRCLLVLSCTSHAMPYAHYD
jgi:hypothetical protein